MNHISETIEKNYNDIDINCSDENADKLIIRLRLVYNPSTEKIPKNEVLSQELLKQFENSLLHDLSLKGIQEIKKVFVKQGKRLIFENISGAFSTDKAKEWIIETDGSNLSKVFLCDEVDFTRTITNDLNEINQNLGIEAVRKALINELRAVLRPYDVYVNYRHIAILCDVMTQRGTLTAITRHGLNRVDLGPLRKCSFEETVDILLEAGLFSENDFLTGITENIMVGQLAPFGTGCFDILLDIDKVKNIKPCENNELMNEYSLENDVMDNNENNSSSILKNSNSFVNFNCLSMQSPNGYSPRNTPILMSPSSNNQYNNYLNTTYNFTPGYNDPSKTSYNNFTPFPEGKSPYYLGANNINSLINSITTPNPYMSPANYGLSSPVNSNYEPYSPIDYESGPNALVSFSGDNILNKTFVNSPKIINSINYSPSNYSIRSPVLNNSSYRDSPNINSINSSFHKINSVYNKTQINCKFLNLLIFHNLFLLIIFYLYSFWIKSLS